MLAAMRRDLSFAFYEFASWRIGKPHNHMACAMVPAVDTLI